MAVVTVRFLVALAGRAVEAGSTLGTHTNDVALFDVFYFLANSDSLSYDLRVDRGRYRFCCTGGFVR